MQLIHLFLADALWISFIFLCAEFMAVPSAKNGTADEMI